MTLHIADITMFYAPASGGVRTFLEAKADWLRTRGLRHSLLVPGERWTHQGEILTLPSPSALVARIRGVDRTISRASSDGGPMQWGTLTTEGQSW